jgi:hypothetical protein
MLTAAARNVLVPSGWLPVAPDLVRGVENQLRALTPGVSLGETFPSLLPAVPPVQPLLAEPATPADSPLSESSTSPSPVPSLVLPSALSPVVVPPLSSMPSALPLSVPSPVLAPPLSATTSGSSGCSGPLSRDSDIEVVAHPSHPLPRMTYRTRRVASSPEGAPASATAATTFQALPEILLSSPVPARASDLPSMPAASTQSTRKRSAAEMAPDDHAPKNWKPCASCKRLKKGCVPDKGAKPPYSACTLCLSGGKTCERFEAGAWAFISSLPSSDSFSASLSFVFASSPPVASVSGLLVRRRCKASAACTVSSAQAHAARTCRWLLHGGDSSCSSSWNTERAVAGALSLAC